MASLCLNELKSQRIVSVQCSIIMGANVTIIVICVMILNRVYTVSDPCYYHSSDVTYACHLKSPATRQLVQQLVQTNKKVNIEAMHYWPFVNGIDGFPHKRTVMWKAFPCRDVIILYLEMVLHLLHKACGLVVIIGTTILVPFHHRHATEWASCQVRKIVGCACAGNAGNVFSATAGLAILTCITARAWRRCRDACWDR